MTGEDSGNIYIWDRNSSKTYPRADVSIGFEESEGKFGAFYSTSGACSCDTGTPYRPNKNPYSVGVKRDEKEDDHV